VPVGDRFNVMFRDENLGTYHSAVAAIDDLISQHTYSPAKMGLPNELSGWMFARTADP
jgi:hypothetical protein